MEKIRVWSMSRMTKSLPCFYGDFCFFFRVQLLLDGDFFSRSGLPFWLLSLSEVPKTFWPNLKHPTHPKHPTQQRPFTMSPRMYFKNQRLNLRGQEKMEIKIMEKHSNILIEVKTMLFKKYLMSLLIVPCTS